MEYPEELALGNIVKLKKPYKPTMFTAHEQKQLNQIRKLAGADYITEQRLATGEIPGMQEVIAHKRKCFDEWPGFSYGIIVEHIGRNAMGDFNVSLQLYDPELGVIFMGPNNIPEYVDHASSEFTLWKAAAKTGYHNEPQPE